MFGHAERVPRNDSGECWTADPAEDDTVTLAFGRRKIRRECRNGLPTPSSSLIHGHANRPFRPRAETPLRGLFCLRDRGLQMPAGIGPPAAGVLRPRPALSSTAGQARATATACERRVPGLSVSCQFGLPRSPVGQWLDRGSAQTRLPQRLKAECRPAALERFSEERSALRPPGSDAISMHPRYMHHKGRLVALSTRLV